MEKMGDNEINRKPLEELKVSTLRDGVMKEVSALHPGWCEERHYLYYKPPPTINDDGSFPIGAKEAWLERIEFLISDLTWLLELEQFRFWSQVIFCEETLHMILSFLQDALPCYIVDEFPHDDEMWNSFQKVHYLVFLVLNRLATWKESENEYITPEHLGKLIYDNYVFTIPMILDICLFYGNENRSQINKMISTIFSIQPQYHKDLKDSVPFICKAFRFVEHKFGGRKLPEGELVKLSERSTKHHEMTLIEFKDLLLHVLDTAVNLSLFLDIYTPACDVFHEQLFEIKIVQFYENTIPQMYRKLEMLANKDDTQPEYVDLKHKLDITRVELLKVFRNCLSSSLNALLENIDSITEAEVKKHVDDYLAVLTECLSEKIFIRDYHSAYPVDQDLDAMSQVCPEMDFMKCDFLLEAVLACFDPPSQKKMKNKMTYSARKHTASATQKNASNEPVAGSSTRKPLTGVKLDSLISEVKDILPHLGDGFVQKCLERYNYVSESVINAILEDSLSEDLKEIDHSLPRIPQDKEVNDAGIGLRINAFDNDEFDIMTQDHVDTSRIHKGKRKGKHKNLNELIDDKSHRAEFREMYSKFGLVDTEGSMYDDEYDDTYDLLDVSVGDEGDLERRPFVVPRVLRNKDEESEEESDGEEEVDDSKTGPPRDEFVPNPEELRAKAEQRRRQQSQTWSRNWRRGGGPPAKDRDVVGQPKGNGQEKQVIINRDHKNVNKSSRGNHNRRIMSQKKRQQGMIS